MVISKTCQNCGTIFFVLPNKSKLINKGDALDGWYFTCQCKSTLFIPIDQVFLDILHETYEENKDL